MIYFDDMIGKFEEIFSVIKVCGIFIEIDDFGMGYVLVFSFMNVELDWLKIERIVVKDVVVLVKV